MNFSTLERFIQGIPKAELHLHIEGSLEAEMVFAIAKKNHLTLDFESVESLKQAYKFNNLQEFLDIYYTGANVLLNESDFYELTSAYLKKVHQENVKHVEIFFDPQTHTDRGVPFKEVIKGIHQALEDGQMQYGISYRLIMSYLRHLDEASAFNTLSQSLPYQNWIHGVGLDSSELGNPPSKFERVFKKSAEYGYKLVAHAGEEGPAEYIWEALDLLNVVRIDHGNRCLDDPTLVDRLVKEKMPLTLCPLSNLELRVVKHLKNHPLLEMLDKGLLATIHSDDPAYFGGYINANYIETAKALNLSQQHIIQLAKNSFEASWLSTEDKLRALKEIDTYVNEFNPDDNI